MTPEELPVRSQERELLEFLDFIDKQHQLSDDLKLLFKDVAVTLYAGALRIFQLFSLCPDSFIDDKNERDLWIGVPRKGDRTAFE